MRVIYADFNDIDAKGNLPLTCVGSRESIRELSEPLCDQEKVWLHDGELGVEATVVRSADGSYSARSEWKFIDVRPEHDRG